MTTSNFILWVQHSLEVIVLADMTRTHQLSGILQWVEHAIKAEENRSSSSLWSSILVLCMLSNSQSSAIVSSYHTYIYLCQWNTHNLEWVWFFPGNLYWGFIPGIVLNWYWLYTKLQPTINSQNWISVEHACILLFRRKRVFSDNNLSS